MKGFYFITDAGLSRQGIINDVRDAIASGVRVIQYRRKHESTKIMYDEATAIKAVCASAGCRLIVNDRIDIALAIDADGVHIGQDDMPYEAARRLLGPHKIIGVTVHNMSEALEAERAGADYLGVSPIFATSTKPDAGVPCGTETLRAIRSSCRIPIAAVGGITIENADAVIEAGADMICAIAAVLTAPDLIGAITQFQRKFHYDTG